MGCEDDDVVVAAVVVVDRVVVEAVVVVRPPLTGYAASAVSGNRSTSKIVPTKREVPPTVIGRSPTLNKHEEDGAPQSSTRPERVSVLTTTPSTISVAWMELTVRRTLWRRPSFKRYTQRAKIVDDELGMR